MPDPIDILRIFIGETSVGRMVISPEQLCLFEYDGDFLSSGFSISPFYLPLRPGVFTARREPFNGTFGVFNDSLPDGWGNLLIDRYLRSTGVHPQSLSVSDRLSIVGSSGMGALSYMPDKHILSHNKVNDINLLAREIKKVLSDVDYEQSLELYRIGTVLQLL